MRNESGELPKFDVVGLYDGLFVMADDLTGTLWNHLTGTGMSGTQKDVQMPIGNLLQMNVRQAMDLREPPEIAISERPYSVEGVQGRWMATDAQLMPMFIETLGPDDERRPRMDMGLGIWAEGHARYYPLDSIRADRYLQDTFMGKPVLIYLDPVTSVPRAVFVETTSVEFHEKVVVLDNDRKIIAGQLTNQPKTDRPLQTYTRWYGFALTFPGAEVFDS